MRISEGKRLISILVFFFSTFILSAQEVAKIRGKVLDAATGLPVPFASVYFNNTSIGAIADSLGNYALNNVPIHHTDLVFSSVGYESYLAKISLSSGQVLRMNAKLRPAKSLLHELVVKGERDKQWKENYDRFVKEFLGNGPNAAQCEIGDAGIIDFHFAGDVLKASAARPLEVINRALGYKIWVTLMQCELGPDYYRISFYSRFEPLPSNGPKEEFRWQINRNQSYKGSLRHFLKALIDKQSESEGFRVYRPIEGKFRTGSQVQVQPTIPVSPDVLFPNAVAGPGNYYQLLKKGVFEIQYLNKSTPRSKRVYINFPHPVSWLEVSDEFLLCPFTGILKSNSNSIASGEMGNNRLADILPEDYDPIPDEGKVYMARHSIVTGKIRGMVTDSSSGKPLRKAAVFINNSLYKTESDLNGQFEIKGIPQGIYSVVVVYGGYTVDHKLVKVKSDSIANLSFPLDVKAPEPWEQPTQGGTEDLKRMYFAKYFVNWHPLATAIQNPGALEIQFFKDKIQMRTRSPLEIIDSKTGYKQTFYLKRSVIDLSENGKNEINSFTSFDTLAATSVKEREKWRINREEYYRGSLSHFIKSLAEGRSKEEGFEIFVSDDAGKRKNKKSTAVAGDSLLVKRKSWMELQLPKNTSVRFEGEKETQLSADVTLWVSAQGTLFPDGALHLSGPMKKKEAPVLPIDYIPLNEITTNGNVLVFIEEEDLKSLQEMTEKTFLHTDKDYYFPSEKIWYKAYLKYGVYQLKDSLSKVLHVELINSKKQIIRKEILKIEDGVSWGDIALPDTLMPGNYYLRAYTRWALNFGDDYIFMKFLPVLSTNQNLTPAEGHGRRLIARTGEVDIETNKEIYKPREKIVVKIKIQNSQREPANANLSVAVTDADKIVPCYWNKSIVQDTLTAKKEKWKRVSQPIEKQFSYDGVVNKESPEGAASVVISAVRNKQVAFARPGHDGRFKFQVDFFDTASFVFRANRNKGSFAGHVLIERPTVPPVVLPAVPPILNYRDDDAKYRIKYSYDPSAKTTMLDEVVVRGMRITESPTKIYTSPITMNADQVFKAKDLNNLSQSIDPVTFWRIMADKIPGSQFDPDNLLILRRFAAAFRVNNLPYTADDMKTLNPADIDRIEIYKLLALVNIYLKTGPDLVTKANEFDRYTLSGYATPSTFYMRDYSKANADDQLPDLRTTIYWLPGLVTENGEQTFSFYAADMPANYRIVVEGLSDEGKPLHVEQIIEVK